MNKLKHLLILLFLLLSATSGYSQFFRIYGYGTLDANEKELVLWNTWIPSSDHAYGFFGEEVARKGLLAHSVELEYGITNRFTVALYADFEQPAGQQLRWIRSKAVMIYYQFSEKNLLPVDLALYGEYKLPRPGYKDYEELEIKLIMEKDLGFHRIILNPTFEKKISGPDVGEGVEFALNGAYTFTQSLVFQPRLEYYSKLGELYEPHGFEEQTHYVFPSIDLFFGKYGQFRWHTGIGIGLTHPADNLIVKSVLSWEFF